MSSSLKHQEWDLIDALLGHMRLYKNRQAFVSSQELAFFKNLQEILRFCKNKYKNLYEFVRICKDL